MFYQKREKFLKKVKKSNEARIWQMRTYQARIGQMVPRISRMRGTESEMSPKAVIQFNLGLNHLLCQNLH